MPVARNRGEHSVSAQAKRYPGPRAARDRLINAKSPTCSVCFHAGTRPPIPTATLGAISDFVPRGFPFLSPAERQAAGLACLLRQVHLVDHGESRVEKDPGELSGRAALPASIRRYIGPSPLTVESARIVAQQLTAQRLCPRAWVEPDREECARERRVGHVGREAAVGVEACTALGHIHAAQHVAA